MKTLLPVVVVVGGMLACGTTSSTPQTAASGGRTTSESTGSAASSSATSGRAFATSTSTTAASAQGSSGSGRTAATSGGSVSGRSAGTSGAGTGHWGSSASSGILSGGTSASNGGSTNTNTGDTGGPLPLPSGFLSTRGSQIVDQQGNPVRIASIGWPGADGPAGYGPQGLWNGNGANYQDIILSAQHAGFNTIRIAWSNASIAGIPSEPNLLDPTINPTLAGLTVMQIFDQFVAYASQIGMKLIFDHHTDDGCGGQQPNGLWIDSGPGIPSDGCGNSNVDAAKFLSDWVAFAKHYAGNDTVIGFDLDNEPLSTGSTWGGGGPTDIQQMYIQTGNAIQAVNPDVLIICEGVIQPGADGYGMDLSVVSTAPVTLGLPNKVVYSVHDYPSEIGAEPVDSGPSMIGLRNTTWGFLVTQGIAPVWIGEMGSDMTSSDAQAWASDLLAYLSGELASSGGPAIAGNDQPVSASWWQLGASSGPDGLQTTWGLGNYRPEQLAVTNRLAFTLPAQR